MTDPTRMETCPTCRIEFRSAVTLLPGSTIRGRVCPANHWHSVGALQAMRERIEREKNPLPPKVKKPKPVTLKSLGFGGHLQAYQLAAVYLLDGYDQALATIPEGTFARAVIEGAFKGRAEVARRILEAV